MQRVCHSISSFTVVAIACKRIFIFVKAASMTASLVNAYDKATFTCPISSDYSLMGQVKKITELMTRLEADLTALHTF